MAVLRCPHCGKPNPDFLDLCQYCERPLKTTAMPPASGGEAAEPPDRLQSEPASESVPDWLKTATGELAGQAPSPADDVPDWLKSLGGVSQGAASSDDVPDWLKTSTGQLPSEATSPLGPATAPIADEPKEPVPDWLKSLGATGPVGVPPDQLDTMPLPGTAPVRDTGAFTTAENVGDALPDWLKSLGATGGMPVPPAPPPAPATGEMPDWLQSVAPADLAPAQPPVTPQPFTTSTEPEPVGADLPDWLRTATGPFITEFTPPTPPPSQPIEPGSPEEEVPDWLRKATGSLDAPAPFTPPAPPPSQPVEPGSPEEEVPDWLRKAPGSLDAPTPSAEPAAGELPDWLRTATGMLAGEPAQPTTPTPAPPEPEGLPDWLKAATGPLTAALTPLAVTPGYTGVTPQEAPPPPAPVMPEVAGLEKGELPDWLRKMTGELAPTVPTAEAPQPVVSETPPASTTAPSVLETEPDWLASLREEPEAVAEPEAEVAPPAAPPAELAQADLPSWLEAMRPVDVAPTGLERETDDYLESVGVLGGLRGVLRAEPSVVLPGKSATNIHLLNYTDAQSRQAALLTKLVATEAPAQVVKARRALSSWPWERWLVTALLLLSLLLTLPGFGPFEGLFPMPRTAPAEVARAFETINTLDAARPVLVAFDYEPGQAGEMTPLADVVVGHLIRRGLMIVGVSTQITGAGVAEDELTRLTGAARGRINDYVRGVHYLNLGFLPGGPLGIRQLIQDPRSVARMGTPASGDLWQTALLSGVQSFNDFGAVIVLSHTPDGARAWVEQTRGVAPKLVLVTSASAAPLVRPYSEGGDARIAGFLGGPAAAMQYDTLGGSVFAVERERPAWSRRWDMLGVGLLTVAGLLFFGNLIHGLLRALAQTRRGKAR